MEIISKLLDDVMIKYSCYRNEISPDDNFTMFVGQNSGNIHGKMSTRVSLRNF